MSGGKQKQANRTKGNVRPSSSGRAAEKLSAASGGKLGFIGFDSMNDLGYVPAAVGNEEADASVDPDFRMVLRKLSKKDATTKLKTIQEFSVLCKEKDEDAVLGALPYWPRLYCKLTTDYDRRVRETTQTAFQQIILRVRGKLAQHLKALMGYWLLAQCDAYAPAASAAKVAFNAAFKPKKQAEAVMFCKNEILAFFEDNLHNTTIQSLSEGSGLSKEEMNSRFEKFITSTLVAIRMFLLMANVTEKTEICPSVDKIIGDSKFWKYGKHKSHQIRGALYSALSAICKAFPDLAVKYGKEISQLTLTNLNETDPCICTQLWEAVLFTVITVKNCWEHVDVHKTVLPKLWKLLEVGGSGNAVVIYPNLLPLLSQFPSATMGSAFYAEFFNNMKTGLCNKKVLISPIETSAIVTAFVECARYILKISLESDDIRTQEFIIIDQVLPLVRACITEPHSSLFNSPLFSKVASLLVFLHTRYINDDTNKDYLDMFWNNFSELCHSVLVSDNDKTGTNFAISRLAVLIVSFHSPVRLASKEASRVRFHSEKPKYDIKKTNIPLKSAYNQTISKNSELIDTAVLLNPDGTCIKLVSELCHDAFRLAKENKSRPHIRFLSVVLAAYKMKCLFTKVLEQFDDGHQSIDVTQAFVQEIVLPWIQEFADRPTSHSQEMVDDQENYDDEDVLSSLIDLLFATYDAAPQEKKLHLLHLVSQLISSARVMSCFTRKLFDLKADLVVQKLLKSDEFSKKLVSFTTNLCAESLKVQKDETKDLSEQWSLLSLALSTDEHLEPLLNKDTVNAILTSLINALPKGDTSHISEEQKHQLIEFICDLATSFFKNVKGCLLMAPSEDLLYTIFQLSTDCKISASPLGVKLNETWQCGVCALLKQQGGLIKDKGFFYNVAVFLKSTVLECSTYERLEEISEHTVLLLNSISPGEDGFNCLIRQEFVKQIKIDGTSALRNQDWFLSPLLEGPILLFDQPHVTVPFSPNEFPAGTAFPAYMSSVILEIKECEEDGKHFEKKMENMLEDVESDILLDALDAMSYCRSLMGRHLEAVGKTQIGHIYDLLQSNLKQLFVKLSFPQRKEIFQRIFDRSIQDGGIKSLSLTYFLLDIINQTEVQELFESTGFYQRFEEIQVTPPVIHTMHASLPFFASNKLNIMVDILAAQLISLPMDGDINPEFIMLSSALSKAVSLQNVEDLNTDVLISAIDVLHQSKESHHNHLCFSSSLDEFTWLQVVYNVEAMKLMSAVILKSSEKITNQHWDFVLCSLVSWVQSCCMSAEAIPSSLKNHLFVVNVCHLVTTVASAVSNFDGHDILREWNEFFSEGIYSVLLPFYISLVGLLDQPEMTLGQEYMLISMGSAVSHCPYNQIENNHLAAKLIASQLSNLPIGLETAVNYLCPMLISNNRAVQVTAYRLLHSFIGHLSQFDVKKKVDDEGEEKDDTTGLSPPCALMTVLQTSTEGVEAFSSDLSVGETILVETYTVEHTASMAYLLCWKLLLAFFKGATSELRVQYAYFIKDNNLVESLLPKLFILMPEVPIINLKESLSTQNSQQQLTSTKSLFADEPTLLVLGFPSARELQHLACTVYYDALKDLPALVRQWVNDLDKNKSHIVNRFTTSYASPILCSEEIQAIYEKDKTASNMTVKGRPVAREVVATYSFEELGMELVVQLPQNYPLGPITVECKKRIGVPSDQWRNWMRQMTTFLNYQNGSIIDGLLIWKRNIDKKFEGVEDCMICYSVIHGSNYSIPKLQCKTCKKKYHSACLYKWFSTSNNSACPLCRNLF